MIERKSGFCVQPDKPTDAQVQNAVNNYLEENPPSGATAKQAAQIEQNTADIAALSDEASAIKSDLSNLSDVTAESVETTVEVEAEIEYSEENTDCRFTLNSDYTKVATSTSALANYTSIVCDVQEGKTYGIVKKSAV